MMVPLSGSGISTLTMWRTSLTVICICVLVLMVDGQPDTPPFPSSYDSGEVIQPDDTTETYWLLDDTDSDDTHVEKRIGQLSLNQDLKTLARLLETQQVRRTGGARQKLQSLGKRGHQAMPRYLPVFLKEFYPNFIGRSAEDKGRKRGGPRLSVSGALSAIADMVQAQSRRRMFQEMAANRASLSDIGKRSGSASTRFLFPVTDHKEQAIEKSMEF